MNSNSGIVNTMRRKLPFGRFLSFETQTAQNKAKVKSIIN